MIACQRNREEVIRDRDCREGRARGRGAGIHDAHGRPKKEADPVKAAARALAVEGSHGARAEGVVVRP